MTIKTITRIATGVAGAGVLAAAALALGAGAASAQQPPTGTWCPGQPPLIVGMELDWDPNVCHDYWYVPNGQGNVGVKLDGKPMDSWIWIGSVPPGMENLKPPPPPPPPAPGSWCANNPVLCHFFGPYGPGSSG